MKTIHISAKCSDLFSAALEDDGKVIGEYEGYVPDFFPGDSDYVVLNIDIKTGKILDWKPPTQAQLNKTFRGANPA